MRYWIDPNFSVIPTNNQAAALAGTGTPSSSNKYVTEDYQFIPTGALMPYAGSSAPTGYLLCDGSAVSRTTYATLFGVISTTYGAGDTTTTFNLPDLRGRLPMGAGTGTGGGASGTGAPTGGSALTARSRGAWLGEETHTLTTTEMPAHTHTVQASNTQGGSGTKVAIGTGSATAITSDSSGSDGAHNNVQPVIVVNYIIKT